MTGRLVAALFTLCACGSKKDPASTTDAGAVVAVDAGALAPRRVLVDLPIHAGECVFGHEGVLIDLGVPAARPLYGIKETATLEATEHDGATWDRISSHTLTFRFAGPAEEPAHEAFVDLRIRGLTAKRVSASLNGKPLGTVALAKGETAIRSLHSTATALTAGTNELVLHFGGLGKAPDAAAEIDWIRVGSQADATYAAPTFDSATTETVGGIPRRAIALRAPAFVRCTAAIPKGATLDAQAGLLGKGSGDIEVRLLRDRVAPLSLGKTHIDDSTGWKPIALTIPDDAQGVCAIELRVDQSTPASRVLVADLKLRAPEHAVQKRAHVARGVVVVVLGQTPATAALLPALSALAATSRVFDAHRATSTWAAASVGSMLTGVLPSEHGAEGDASRLVDGIITVGEAAREAGISTAMFTANPTTSAAFGFARGFQTFVPVFPGTEGGATHVIEEAATWIGAHKTERFVVVVHARGGHPPWEVPPDALKALPPENYTGPIEPGAHAAEILARARRVPPLVRFNDADRKRAWALHDFAVASHDGAIGRLLAAIDDAGRRDDTAIIVTSDTGMDAAAHVPFGDAEPLEEGALASLLVVHSAGESAPSRVHAPTSAVDIATTVLAELGLAAPVSFEGEDLASAQDVEGMRALFASSAMGRAGTLVSWTGLLYRTNDTVSELCVPALDAACSSDAAPLAPIASEALRKLMSTAASKKHAVHTAPMLDGPTAAALTSWGR